MPSSHLLLQFSTVKFKPSPGTCQVVWREFAKDLQTGGSAQNGEPGRGPDRPSFRGGGLSVENGSGRAVTHPEAVWLYSDGVYRWVYARDLTWNRFEANYVLRIVILIFAISWVTLTGICVVASRGAAAGMAFAITTGICLGGGLISAGVYRLANRAMADAQGGVDLIGFQMSEEGVRQTHSAGKLDANALMVKMLQDAGAIDDGGQMRPGGFGVTRFQDVRRMNVHPRYDLIDLTLTGNYKCRVYVRPEDMDFVKDYIEKRIR